MPTNSINRRRFLATSALAAGAASASALLPDRVASTEAAADRGVTTLTVMYGAGELSTKEVKIFEQQNPSIKVHGSLIFHRLNKIRYRPYLDISSPSAQDVDLPLAAPVDHLENTFLW